MHESIKDVSWALATQPSLPLHPLLITSRQYLCTNHTTQLHLITNAFILAHKARSTMIPAYKVLKSSDGCEIHAEATGDPSHPHVVLVHGYTLSGAVFDDFCRVPILNQLYIVKYITSYSRDEVN